MFITFGTILGSVLLLAYVYNNNYHISVIKQLIFKYETYNDLTDNVPMGISMIKEEHGYFYFYYKERINSPVYTFMSKTNPIAKMNKCSVISAELIVDEKEGIDITAFINKLACPDGRGHENWTPEEISNYLNIRFQNDVKIALIVSESFQMHEFSGKEFIKINTCV